jgi:PAS domain S-box-containing protein
VRARNVAAAPRGVCDRRGGTAIRIRAKLTLALTCLALVPLAIISLGAYAYARRAVERSVLNHLESLVTTQKQRIQSVVATHERMLVVAASNEVLLGAVQRVRTAPSPRAEEDARRILLQWRSRYPGFRNLAVLGPEDRVLATTDADRLPTAAEPSPMSSHPEVLAASLAGPFEPTAARLDGQRDFGMVVFVSRSAVYMRAGYLLAELDLEDLHRITLDYRGMGQTGETVLARRDRDGNALYLTALRSDPDAALQRVVPAGDSGVAIARALRGEESVRVDAIDYRHVPVLSATAYLPREDWGIVVKIDRAEAFAPLERLAHGLAAVFAFACLGVVAVGYVFTNRITAPIVRLTRVAQDINRGELGQRVTVTTGDEIGVLGHAFNRMTAELLAANARLADRVQDRTAALGREIAGRARAERRFELAFQQGPEPMVMLDAAGAIVLANQQVERVFGHGRDELAGRHVERLFPEREWATLRTLREQLIADPAPGRVETALQLSAQAKDGTELPVDLGLSVVEVANGVLLLGIIRDLRERQRAEAAQAILAAVVDSAHDAIFSIDTDLRITTWNAGAEHLFGYRAEQVLGKPVALLWPAEDIEKESRTSRALMDEQRSMYNETRRRHRDGRLIDISLTRSPIRTPAGKVLGLSTIARDIGLRKQAELAMRASLHEKEVLLKEIHHRVKNNLQIVTSLLSLQAGGVDDPRITALMRETQHRVKSMALMHETLYRGGNLAALDLRKYVHELVDYLRHSYGPALRRVAVVVDVDSLPLPIDSAIPCGLILTELVSNAFKHAFPEPMTGTLRVEGRPGSAGTYVLRVVDDGRGMPREVDPLHSRSLGLQLVDNLARQLRGEFTRDAADRGTHFTIRFATSRVGQDASAAATR